MDNFHETVIQQQTVFSQSLPLSCSNTDCYRRSLLPTAITIYHNSLKKTGKCELQHYVPFRIIKHYQSFVVVFFSVYWQLQLS